VHPHRAIHSALLWREIVLAMLAAAVSGHAVVQDLPSGTVADRIVVQKSARTLSVFRGNVLLKTYKVALGPNPKGHKEREGDGRTPEGIYTIDPRNETARFIVLCTFRIRTPKTDGTPVGDASRQGAT